MELVLNCVRDFKVLDRIPCEQNSFLFVQPESFLDPKLYWLGFDTELFIYGNIFFFCRSFVEGSPVNRVKSATRVFFGRKQFQKQ